MDKIFLIGVVVGIISRGIMLNTDKHQYPTKPNNLVNQFILAFVASSLGALLVPALIERSYTSITFLSLAAEQFRQVRELMRTSLEKMEDAQLVKRGEAFIEEIARTYEVRNYMCIITSFMTVASYYLLTTELKTDENITLFVSTILGLILAFIMKKTLRRKQLYEIADVRVVDISFVNKSILKVGDLAGITNVGLESDRKRFLEKGVGIEIIPKDGSYQYAGIIQDPGQRQTIIYNLYSRLGIYRENYEPTFYPLPRRNAKRESLVIAYVPVEKDVQKVIEAVKSTPILSTSRGRNISLNDLKINEKGSV